MKKSIFVLFLLQFLFFSCGNDCDSERIDDQFLEMESLEFQSWKGKEEYIYKDLQGNEVIFTVQLAQDTTFENIRVFLECDEDEFIVFASETSFYIFEGPDGSSIAYGHSIEAADDIMMDPDQLVDRLRLSIVDEDVSILDAMNRAVYITHPKQATIDVDFLNMVAFTKLDSIEIGDKTFYDVFQQRNTTESIVFSKEEGIVSFFDKNGDQLYLFSCK